MKQRWSDPKYAALTTASMKAAFDIRWINPEYRRKVIKYLTSIGTSKLEKRVAAIAKQYGFIQSVAVDRYLADLLKDNIIIEVNGDYWHCNPVIWKENDIHPFKKVSAKNIWEHDRKRKEHLQSLGYTVYEIWERDIVSGKDVFIHSFIKEIINEQAKN